MSRNLARVLEIQAEFNRMYHPEEIRPRKRRTPKPAKLEEESPEKKKTRRTRSSGFADCTVWDTRSESAGGEA